MRVRLYSKGNLVAVISNGTAILGLGNLGALASKPVMEGKAVLFKRFADVDAIDIEVDTKDAQRFIEAVELLGPSFGGINLEDIAAPDCFVIEQTLKERMNIPVFHDDQHGTAIITAAGLINACVLTARKLGDIRVVVNGAGAAAIACTELIKAMGVKGDHVIMCDRKGVIYKGRTDIDQWKSAHAVETDARTLAEALKDADVFLGLSAAGALKPEMVKSMAKDPIIFAMANPDPEIWPPDATEGAARRDPRHRALGLPQPGQQRSRLPVHLPRRARCSCDRDQRRNEDRRRRGAWPSWPASRCPRRLPPLMAVARTASGAITSSRRRSIRD